MELILLFCAPMMYKRSRPNKNIIQQVLACVMYLIASYFLERGLQKMHAHVSGIFHRESKKLNCLSSLIIWSHQNLQHYAPVVL